MTTDLRKIAVADMPIVERMFQFYLYDMSQFARWPLSPQGDFAYPSDLLPPYWDRTDHYPYFIMQDGEIAGFCLVRRAPDDDQLWDMGQFFVLRKFRKIGLGHIAFAKALSLHAGDWQVRVLPDNKLAYQFWKSRIADIACESFTETSQNYNDASMVFFRFKI